MLSRGRVLLGAFADVERAAAFVERVSTTPGEIVRERWPEARRAFLAAPAVAAVEAPALDERSRASIEEILSAPLFAEALASKRWRVACVGLHTLVVPQPLVNLGRIAALASRVAADVAEAFFPLTTSLDVATTTAKGPTISFSSSRGELTVSGASMRRLADDGAIEVVFRVEPRPNYVSVLDDGGTLVLRNGHHRAVAAWAAGLRAVPCVVVEGSIDALAARMTSAVPAEELRRVRPPLLRDLAEPGPASLDVELRPKRHALHLAAQHEVVYA